MPNHYCDRLQAAIDARRTCAVVGIDPVREHLPPALRGEALDAVQAIERFATAVIDVVAPLVPAVKINSAFFEAYRAAGVAVYFRTVARAHQRGLLVIGDVKRGDIGSTAELYARGHLVAADAGECDSVPDAVTVSAYLGASAARPFVDVAAREGRGVYVLVRPSDPGSDLIHEFGGDTPLYQHLGRLVAGWGDRAELLGGCGYSCVGAVVAPKDAASTAALRAAMPRTPFLVPGYGAQGATAEACRPCFAADGRGAVVNASRSVIYAFNQPRYARRFGSDWEACVRAACEDFVADLASLSAATPRP